MSESDYEPRDGSITTFYSPSLFWFIFDDELLSRNNFNKKLNHPSVSYTQLTDVCVGQNVITINGKEWGRAEVVDIQEQTLQKEYICWLLDYGVFFSTPKVFKLPLEAKLVPSFAHKAMLHGLRSIIMDYDFAVKAPQEHREKEWVPGIRRCVSDILKTPNISQTFKKRFSFEEYLIGDLFIRSEDTISSLSDAIIAKGLAVYDEIEFFSSLRVIKMVEKSLTVVYMQTRYYNQQTLVKVFDGEKKSVGRGTFRFLETYVRDCQKKSRNVQSSLTCADQEKVEDDSCRKMPRNIPSSLTCANQEKIKDDSPIEEPRTHGTGISNKFKKRFASKCSDATRKESDCFNDNNLAKSLEQKNNSYSSSGRGFRKIEDKEIADQDKINDDSPREEPPIYGTGMSNKFKKIFASKCPDATGKESGYSNDDNNSAKSLEQKNNSCSSSGRGFKKIQEPEIQTQKIGLSGAIKKLKLYSGRGFKKAEEHSETKQTAIDDFDYSNFEDADNKIKSTCIELKKNEPLNVTKNDNRFSSAGCGFTKSTEYKESSFENNETFISAGRGFAKPTKFHSAASSQYENDSDDETNLIKSVGHGFPNSIKSDSETDIFSPNETFGRGYSKYPKSTISSSSRRSSEDTFSDADEVASKTTKPKKSAIFRDSTPIVNVLDFQPAGTNLSAKHSKKNENQNFQFPLNQKRPPEETDTGLMSRDKNAAVCVKKFLDSFNDYETTCVRKHKKVAGLCECKDCAGWRNDDRVFEQPIVEKPTPKQKIVIKPPLLFKNTDEEEILFKINTDRSFANEVEKLAAPRLLVHGFLRAEPATDLPHIPFDEKVQKSLRQLNYSSAYSIQTYAWPAVLRGHNVIVVSGPECGKTMVYVPTICSFAFNPHPNLPQDNGPISIILCPRVKIVENVYRSFNGILKRIYSNDIKVQAVVQLHEKNVMNRLEQGVDILLTTPRLLISMLKSDFFNLKRFSHLVLEEAQDLFSLYSAEVNFILNKGQKILESRTLCIPIQVIAIAQEWNKSVEDFAKKFRVPPLICIGAHLQAALYGKADIKVTLSQYQEKNFKLIQMIKDKTSSQKTVIICNDTDDPTELLKYLNAHGILFEYLLFESPIEDVNAIKTRWFNSVSGHYFVLVCSDHIFNTGFAITDADIIVQYTLPENWSQFTFRFSGFLDKYTSPLVTRKEYANKCKMHIIIDDTNKRQFPKMLHYLQQMKTKLPQSLLNYYNALLNEIEEERLRNDKPICYELLCFGSCRNTISCKSRHILSPENDICSTLPKSGLIKFKILHILSPMQYFVRLIEYKDAEGASHDISDYYSLIASQLLVLKDEHQKLPPANMKIGTMCAVEETDTATRGTFQRCKILNIEKRGHLIRRLLIRFIDLGFEQHVLTSQLYCLPPKLHKIPAQAIPLYISNIGPPDKDLTWAFRTLILLRQYLKKAGHYKANCYFSARIKLQVNDALFVDDLKLQEIVENDSLIVQKLSVCEVLSRMKSLEKRPDHLENLYKQCLKYKIPLYDYSLPVIKATIKIEPQIEPSWAHLETTDECNMVYFCLAHNPGSFFVKLCKNTGCLDQLNKDIAAAMSKPFYRTVVTPLEGRCYLVKDSDENFYTRAIVKKLKATTAECFFVDYGDMTEVAINDLKFLPDDLIKQLPFQVIECKLYGLEPAGGASTWLSESTDIFYDIAYEPGTDFLRFLHVKIMGEEKAEFTGFKKYSVILLDTFEQDIVINNLLLDKGYAIQTCDERIEVDFNKLSRENCESVEHNEENPVTLDEYEEIDHERELDDKWDFQLNDPLAFFRDLAGGKENLNTGNTIKEQRKSNGIDINLKALPLPGYSTPRVIWGQTVTHITMHIKIPAVTEYDVHILRGRVLTFKTTNQNIKYRVDLNLFTKVHSNIEHRSLGLYILIKMEKQVQQEWPRLVLSMEKQRHITYNVALLEAEDDSDDDKPLPSKKFIESKKLGNIMKNDDENGQFVYEYGSDIDWDESDVESEHESQDS